MGSSPISKVITRWNSNGKGFGKILQLKETFKLFTPFAKLYEEMMQKKKYMLKKLARALSTRECIVKESIENYVRIINFNRNWDDAWEKPEKLKNHAEKLKQESCWKSRIVHWKWKKVE